MLVEQHAAIGEGSTNYLVSEIALTRILQFNAAARFIVMLRNPVDLVHSLHTHNRFSGWDDQPRSGNFGNRQISYALVVFIQQRILTKAAKFHTQACFITWHHVATKDRIVGNASSLEIRAGDLQPTVRKSRRFIEKKTDTKRATSLRDRRRRSGLGQAEQASEELNW